MLKSALTLLLSTALLASYTSACKTPGSGSRIYSNAASGPACPLAENWAGRMGMRLVDGSGGALVDCVVTGKGLNHIGILPGDLIVGLNNGASVKSAQNFEEVATQIAAVTDEHAARHWQFVLVRGGQQLNLEPPASHPGCGLFFYTDCGPLK